MGALSNKKTGATTRKAPAMDDSMPLFCIRLLHFRLTNFSSLVHAIMCQMFSSVILYQSVEQYSLYMMVAKVDSKETQIVASSLIKQSKKSLEIKINHDESDR